MHTVKAMIDKIGFKIRMAEMDLAYFLFGWSCFSLFPPSFYYTHTPKEIEEITNRELESIRKLLDEMDAAQ